MQRRTVLGALVISFIDGQVFRARAAEFIDIPAGPAFEPWRTWREDSGKGPLALVRAAILAANAYNSQPWKFHVTGSRIELMADTSRNLGAFDPYMREMHFSLGCALENLMLAAGPNGFRASLAMFPGELAPIPETPGMETVARIDLAKSKRSSSELYDAIPHRHTNRNVYDPAKPVPAAFQRALEQLGDAQVKIFLFEPEEPRQRIVGAIADASGRFLSDPEVQRGTRNWIRTSREEMDKFRDGTLVERSGSARPASLDDYKRQMLAAPLFGLIGVRDRYDREQTIRAGRAWQRAHLMATAAGIAARPANGAVELIDHERRLNREPRSMEQLASITGDVSWQPTFMFYMGYADPAKASPRRSVELAEI